MKKIFIGILLAIFGLGILGGCQFFDKKNDLKVEFYSNSANIIIEKNDENIIYSSDFLFLKYINSNIKKDIVVVVGDAVYDKNSNDIKIETSADFEKISVKIYATGDVKIIDDSTLKKEYEVIIDKRLPVGKLINVNDKKFVFNWEENELNNHKILKASLNGKPYKKNEEITNPGNHQITLEDQLGNKAVYNFKIAIENLKGTLIGVENNGITNKNVSFYWEDEGKAFLNGEEYYKGKIINKSGYYEIVYENYYGERNIYNFKIDKEKPTGKFIKTVNYGNVDEIIFTWNKEETTAILNDEPYEKGNIIPIKENDQITLTDLAGNKVTYYYDEKDLPTGNFIFKYNYKIKHDLFFEYDETKMTALCNNDVYKNNMSILDGGVIILINKLGNITIYDSSQNFNDPNLEFSDNLNHNLRTSQNFSVKWDNNISETFLNGENYESGTIIDKEGKYEFKAKDIYDNKYVCNIMIDKTKPKGSFSLENSSKTLKSLFVNSHDENTYFATDSVRFFYEKSSDYPGEENNAEIRYKNDYYAQYYSGSYYSGGLIIKRGFYEIILKDSIGNESIYKIAISGWEIGYLVKKDGGVYYDKSLSFYPTVISLVDSDEQGILGNHNLLEYTNGIYFLEIGSAIGHTGFYFEIIDEKVVIRYIAGDYH